MEKSGTSSMNEDSQTLKAHIDGVDVVAQRMEAKWGMGRLPLIVSTETRAKFYRQGLRFREALEDCYGSKVITRDKLDAVIKSAGGMERAWSALDREAVSLGEKPIDPDVWEVVLSDGSILAVVQTNADAHKVIEDGRIKNVWTLEEVSRAVEAFPDIIRSIKETFPGATVEPVKRERYRGKLDDPLPF